MDCNVLFWWFVTILFETTGQDMGAPPFRTLIAKRGRFFIYRLHSIDFFGSSPPVSWSGSVVGRPELPSWLNLAQSPYSQMAFLYGTPLLTDSSTNILIIAKDTRSFAIARKTFAIHIRTDNANDRENEDNNTLQGRYSVTMAQLAELWITNIEAWEILAQTNLAEDLQRSVRKAFRGKGVRPYVRDLKPATAVGARVPLTEEKVGVVAYVGTRQGFPIGILYLEKGLAGHKEQCHRHNIIPIDKYFRPKFLVDWCRFVVNDVNGTTNWDGDKMVLSDREGMNPLDGAEEGGNGPHPFQSPDFLPYSKSGLSRDYFLDWVLVVVVPAAVLIIVLLVLCIVFFGGREGQHWRDHKTPDDQLKEYMSLRQSQQKLRELSTQRQSLLEEEEAESLNQAPFFRNGSAVRNSKTISPSPSRGPTPGPVGKQTVIEAAAARGSRLDLYEEPGQKEEDQRDLSETETTSEADTVVNAEEDSVNRGSSAPRVAVIDTAL